MVLKLYRERPAYFSLETNKLFSAKDSFLRTYNMNSQKEIKLITLKRPVSIYGNKRVPLALSYSKTGHSILLSFGDQNYAYELYDLPLEASSTGTNFSEPKVGFGGTALFITWDRFVVIDKVSNEIIIKNLQNQVVKKNTLPIIPDFIYRAGNGNIMCRNKEGVSLFDLSQLSQVGKLTVPSVKYVFWSNDMKLVALVSKNSLVLATDKLVKLCTVSEAVRVKSGAWDEKEKENGLFIYNTWTHLKYLLLNGDNGIIQNLLVPVRNPNLKTGPILIFDFAQLDEKLKKAYKAFTIGKLNESLKLFLNILHTLPLVKVDTRKELEEMKELIGIAREYSLGLKIEIKRNGLKDDLVKQQELAAYFANRKLQRGHLRIVLSNAMSICYKNRNYKTAAYFARALLQNEPSEIQANNAKKVIEFQASGLKLDENELRFDAGNPNFEVCGMSFVAIYKGERDLTCAYCGAHFLVEFKGKVCGVCEIGKIGGERVGLVCSPAPFGK